MRRIEAAPKVCEYLGRLEEDGCDASQVLGFLEWIVQLDLTETLRHLLLVEEELLKRSIDLHVAMLDAAVLLLRLGPISPEMARSAVLLPELTVEAESQEQFKARVEAAHEQSLCLRGILDEEFGKVQKFRMVLSEHGRARALEKLLIYVKESTGKYHDDWIADLLQAAHDALGKTANFSAEGLRKLRQRKLRQIVRASKRAKR
jgi:hypothetical protein